MRQKVADYLADHPKMTGVLFMTMLLLSQAAPASANIASSCPGP